MWYETKLTKKVNTNSFNRRNDTAWLILKISVLLFFTFLVIHLFEINSNGTSTSYTHKVGITNLVLSQTNMSEHRLLAFIDKNRDLYLMAVNTATTTEGKRKCEKLGMNLFVMKVLGRNGVGIQTLIPIFAIRCRNHGTVDILESRL